MIFLLLAKLIDPVAIVLGLIVGRFSRSWIIAAVLAGVLAFAGEWLISGGSPEAGKLLAGLISASLWTALGHAWRVHALKKKQSQAPITPK